MSTKPASGGRGIYFDRPFSDKKCGAPHSALRQGMLPNRPSSIEQPLADRKNRYIVDMIYIRVHHVDRMETTVNPINNANVVST